MDVGALLDSAAASLIGGLVDLGLLVSLGTTADGGALGLTLTSDGKFRREYFRDSDDLCDYLEAALKAFTDDPPRASSGQRGTRGR